MKFNLVYLIIIMLGTASCIPLAIGAGAGAGYVAANENRDEATIASDDAITSQINKAFALDQELTRAHLDVDTYRGVVTLRGSVKDVYLRDRAVSDAWAVQGVKDVTSKILVRGMR